MSTGQIQKALFDEGGTEGNIRPGQPGGWGHAASPGDLVPFGKFKGQALSVLLANADYALWLLNAKSAQLRTSHPAMYAWLVTHFGAPENTPEHNQLTNRFLDHDFRLQLALRINNTPAFEPARSVSEEQVIRAWTQWLPRRIAQVVDLAQLDDWSGQGLPKEPESRKAELRRRATANLATALDKLRVYCKLKQTTPEIIWSPVLEASGPKFEVGGADVEFSVGGRVSIAIDEDLNNYGDNSAMAPTLAAWNYSAKYRVEAKPFVGDDYPTILRTMVATSCNVLLIDAFDAEGATLEQLRKVFLSQGVHVALLDEVITTEVPSSVRELVIPGKNQAAMWKIAMDVLDNELTKLCSKERL